MRILLLTDGISPYVLGGMQKHSTLFAKHLSLQGVYVTLVHAVPANENVPSEEDSLQKIGGDNHYLKVVGFKFPNSSKLPGHYIRDTKKYSQLLFEKFKNELDQYDLIYCQGFVGWTFYQRKKEVKGMPTIGANLHGLNMFQAAPNLKVQLQNLFLLRPLAKQVCRHSDLIFSFEGKIMEISKSLISDESKIIPWKLGIDESWIDQEQFESAREDKIKFLFVGRYDPVKGIELIYHVIDKLKEQVDLFEFSFVGPFPEDKKLKAKNVEYYGEIQDETELRAICQKADVLLCPSISEGMPNVILEAMASNCVIIASNVGAIPVLVDDSNGILIEPNNKGDLLKAIRSISNLSSEELGLMKRSSREKIKSFEWSKVTRSWLELLGNHLQ